MINTAPVAADDAVTTSEDTSATVDVLANDTDPDGDALTVIAAGTPANGATVLNADGTITYTPAAGFSGSDSFIYLVGDGNGGYATASVGVTVTADAINTAPVAADDAVTTSENTSATVDVLANDTDPDGDALTVTAAGTPANGTTVLNADGTITYTPAAGFSGSDSFIYLVGDGNGGFASAAVGVTVTANAINTAPVAADDAVTTSENASATVDVLANDTDPDGDALTVTAAGTPANGTTVLNADGTITYTPAAGFSGSDSFVYVVGDGNGGFASAAVGVTVTANAINTAPVAADDAVTTSENASATVDVLANDTDPDGDALTVTAAGTPANGTTVLNADGTITYTPAAGFSGSDSFIYLVGDGNGGFASAAVGVTVTANAINTAPVAADDAVTTSENASATVDVLANDTDPDGDALTVTAAGTPANGTTVLNADGTITYTPAAGFSGSDSFIYVVGDGNGGFASAAVGVTVTANAINTAPVAADDAVTTSENASATVDVLANDTDPDGDALTVTAAGTPANGTTVLNADGTITYTPAAGFSGSDSFIYVVGDGNGGFASAAVGVTVTANAINTAPVAADDAVTTSENASATVDVLANDTDPDGDALTVTAAGTPANGTTVLNADGTITYTPAAGFSGSDSFIYVVGDGNGGFASAAVGVTVTANAINTAPVAADDAVTTSENASATVDVLANDTDPDGDALTVTAAGTPANGTTVLNADGTITYTPAAGFSGSDSFVYVVGDGNGGFASAAVGVTVTANAINTAPVAADDAVTTSENASATVDVLANDTDPDGDALTVTAAGTPANGTTVLNADGTITYTPAAGFSGSDSFIYVVGDGNGGFASAAVGVTVTANAINTAPVAADDAVTTSENASATVDVLANDTDPDGDALTVTAAGTPANGTTVLNADGTITYTPAAGFSGSDSFIYVVGDGNGGFASAAVGVTVTADGINTAPVAADDAVATSENTSATVDVLANDTDPDGDALTVIAAGTPFDGATVLNADGTITYTPAAGFRGWDSFVYIVGDGNGGLATAFVSVAVSPDPTDDGTSSDDETNHTPVAVDDTFTMSQNETLSVNGILDNDLDADGDALIASLVYGPTHGTLALNTDGSFSYTPAKGFVGTDSFVYRANDGNGGTDTATASVTVENDSGPPLDIAAQAASMAPGEWRRLDTANSFESVSVTVTEANALQAAEGGYNIWGWGGPTRVLEAWNSSAYDAAENRMFFWGGGHASYGGNEVYEFDFDTLTWTRLTDPAPLTFQPDPSGQPYNWLPEDTNNDGIPDTPPVPHTYDGFVWNPDTETFWVTMQRGVFPSGSLTPGQDVLYEFDPATRTWQHHAAVDHGISSGTFLSDTNQVLFVNHFSTRNDHAYLYDSDGAQHSLGQVLGDYMAGDDAQMFQNPYNGNVYEAHYDGIFRLDITSSDITATRVLTFPTLEEFNFKTTYASAGYAYNNNENKFYIWNGDTQVVTWNPFDNSFDVLWNESSSGDSPSSISSLGGGKVLDKWVYVDDSDVFLGITSSGHTKDGGFWLYKPGGQNPSDINQLDIGVVQLDARTSEMLGLFVPIESGDRNYDGTAEVSYRELGSSEWQNGTELLRLRPEFVEISHGFEESPDGFAGLLPDLKAGTVYEIKIEANDPDGLRAGSEPAVQILTASTRTIPITDPVLPNTVSVSNMTELQSAIAGATAGDVIVMAPGTYVGSVEIRNSGTESNPIVLRGADRSTTILDGGGESIGLYVRGDYIHVENLTIQNADLGIIVYGTSEDPNTEGIAIRGNYITDVSQGIVSAGFGSRGMYIADNVLEGRFAPLDTVDGGNAEGIVVAGEDIEVVHNTLSGFIDSLGVTRQTEIANIGIDIHHNLVLWGADDGIEFDFSLRNVQAHHNLIANHANGLSFQPVYGGPAYAYENVMYNMERGPLKIKPEHDNPHGMLVFNNTSIKSGVSWVDDSGSVTNATIVNNLFVGQGEEAMTLRNSSGYELSEIDYNAWSQDGSFQLGLDFGDNFSEWVNNTPWGSHDVLLEGEAIFDTLTLDFGVNGFDVFRDPQASDLDFNLDPDSSAVDAGRVIRGFNEDYAGVAPDIGAFELGEEMPDYGAFWSP